MILPNQTSKQATHNFAIFPVDKNQLKLTPLHTFNQLLDQLLPGVLQNSNDFRTVLPLCVFEGGGDKGFKVVEQGTNYLDGLSKQNGSILIRLERGKPRDLRVSGSRETTAATPSGENGENRLRLRVLSWRTGTFRRAAPDLEFGPIGFRHGGRQ